MTMRVGNEAVQAAVNKGHKGASKAAQNKPSQARGPKGQPAAVVDISPEAAEASKARGLDRAVMSSPAQQLKQLDNYEHLGRGYLGQSFGQMVRFVAQGGEPPVPAEAKEPGESMAPPQDLISMAPDLVDPEAGDAEVLAAA